MNINHRLTSACSQVPARQRHDDGKDAAGNRGEHREPDRVARPEPGGERRQQLHVAGAHAAEREKRKKQRGSRQPPGRGEAETGRALVASA